MAKTKEQKEQSIKTIQEQLDKMKSLIFVDYYGLKVNEIGDFRQLLKKQNCKYLVTKKTLLDIVLKKAGLNDIDLKKLEGGLGVIFGFDSEIEPAKLVVKFAKEHDKLKVRGGIFENSFITAEKIHSLSKLPTKQELLSQLVGVIKGPITGFVNALKGNLRNFVYILKGIQDNK